MSPDEEDRPMYVVVHDAPHAVGRFKRALTTRFPYGELAVAEEVAGDERDIAEQGGRVDDRYEVYELRKVEG